MFERVNLPVDMAETLAAIFIKAKRINPVLTEEEFIERALKEWLKPYKRDKIKVTLRKNVVLRNRLKNAIQFCGKSQTQLAQEVGVSRTYLGHVISGKCEPSVTLAILITDAIGYPLEKLHEVFYLEPME